MHRANSSPRGNRRKIMMLAWTASAASVLCLGGSMLSVASAQSSSAPVVDSARPATAPLSAPVGHRQPREKDLPPAISREEQQQRDVLSRQRAFDRSLQICRGC